MIKIKNWSSHQSYKDRKPPWIRLHKTMLDDYEFHLMSVNARALLPMLWLLASEDEDPTSGLIRNSFDKIAFRLRASKKDVVAGVRELEASGFIEGESQCNETVTKRLQDRSQSVTPETEAEAYSKETEKERGGGLENLSVSHIEDWLSEKRSQGKYVKHDEHEVLEQFKDYCRSKGKTYKDYVAAYRNAFKWERCQPKENKNGQSKFDTIAEGAGRAAAKQAKLVDENIRRAEQGHTSSTGLIESNLMRSIVSNND